MDGSGTQNFGALLRHLRREAHLTQEELAERAHVSTRTISDLERGVSHAPYRGTIDQLARALEVGPDASGALRDAGQRRRGPPAESAPPAELRAPEEITPLLGREREEADALRLLSKPQVRLLTLTGVGGVGKTRLAQRLARSTAAAYNDDVLFVPLATVRDAALVPPAVGRLLGMREEGGTPVRERLVRYCASRRMLLLLDNFEQVLDAALFVRELLDAGPGPDILITSRVPLHLQGEQEMSISPLALPGSIDGTDDSSSAARETFLAPSVALFIQRAFAVKPDLVIAEEDAPVVAEICRRLDGLPLAIELAAARVKVLSPNALLNRLDRRLPILTSASRDLPARHQTMRDTIAWSYDLLTPADRRLFRVLSTFIGGFDIPAVQTISGWDDPIDGLSALVDASLITVAGNGRFGMLETVREFAVERLIEEGEDTRIRERHLTYFQSMAHGAEAGLTGPEESVWLRRLEMEHDNLRAAMQWTRERGDTVSGLRLASGLWRFWFVRGHLPEGRQQLSDLLREAGSHIPEEVHAAALYAAGALAFGQSDADAALDYWLRALPVFRRWNDPHWLGTILNALGAAMNDASEYSGAVDLLRESLMIRRALGEKHGLAATLNNLANAARYLGYYRKSVQLYEQSLQVYESLAIRGSKAMSLNNLAIVALEVGDLDRAERLSEQSLELLVQSSSAEHIGKCKINMADVALERRQYERAEALYEDGLRDYMATSDLGSAGGAMLGLGQLALARGNLQIAEVHAIEAERLKSGLDRRGLMDVGLLQADIKLARGEVRAAGSTYRHVLEEASRRGLVLTVAQALDCFGWVAGVEERWREAVVRCAAAEKLLEDTEAAWTRTEKEHREAMLAHARSILSDEAVGALRRRGQSNPDSVLAEVSCIPVRELAMIGERDEQIFARLVV